MDRRLHELVAINRVIAASLDYEEVLALVVDKTVELTSADVCALLLADEQGIARIAAHRGIEQARADAFAASFDERISAHLRQLLSYETDDHFLGVPVVHKGTVAGLLVVQRLEPERPPSADDEMLLSALADQAAIALDHASRYRQLWLESQQARRELEVAAQRKDQYLAMLAHELRNPLAAVVSAMAVLEARGSSDPLIGKAQEAASRQALHMKRLLDDLLDVSRVTRGKISLDERTVEVQEIVAHAVQSVQPLYVQRQHELVVEVPDEPLLVRGDHDRLVQVASNLLDNAAKYSEPGGHVRVVVTAREQQVELRVRDRGRGIAPDVLPSVFELFVQESRGLHRSEGGLGIGLTLVRDLVRLHGGEVEAHSEGEGRGCEMVVRLPLMSPSTELEAGPAHAPCRTTSRRVLLVEDDDDVAAMLSTLLRINGHRVTVASDGESALESVAAEAPEVMIIDIGLPGMDGYELAQRVRGLADRPRPVLVAVTGYGQEQDRQRSRESGFDHHLVKPVSGEQLELVLSALP